MIPSLCQPSTVLILLFTLLSTVQSTPTSTTSNSTLLPRRPFSGTNVYVIRHGEKPADGSGGLTRKGRLRAQCIKHVSLIFQLWKQVASVTDLWWVLFSYSVQHQSTEWIISWLPSIMERNTRERMIQSYLSRGTWVLGSMIIGIICSHHSPVKLNVSSDRNDMFCVADSVSELVLAKSFRGDVLISWVRSLKFSTYVN